MRRQHAEIFQPFAVGLIHRHCIRRSRRLKPDPKKYNAFRRIFPRYFQRIHR